MELKEIDKMHREPRDLHWLAGLLEGEGSFSLHQIKAPERGNVRATPYLQLKMTDPDVVKRAADLMGVNFKGPYNRGEGYKDIYTASAVGVKAVGWMMTLYSLLGIRRQERIREILAYWKETPARGKNLKGPKGVRPFSPGKKKSDPK